MASHPYRALVVDDEPLVRRLLFATLEHAGFACDGAQDGIEAQQLLKATKYDLVVTDIRMPKKHGHSLALELLADPKRPVLIIHTGVDEPRLTADLMLRGVDDIVYKPTNYATLAARAQVLVERRRAALSAPDGKSGNATTSESNQPVAPSSQTNIADAIPACELLKRLSDVSDVCPLSHTALNAYRLATEGQAPVAEIARAIAEDAALSADVLRTGNSAHYNRTGKRTADLSQLIARIGHRRVGELALAASVRSALTKRQIPWLDTELTWKRSVAASIAVDEIIKQGRHESVEQGLFLSALMHPMGRIVLATAFPERHESLTLQAKQSGEPLRRLEKQAFSWSHSAVMAELLSRWRIPRDVTSPLEGALDSFSLDNGPSERERTRSEIVKLAILIGRLAVGTWEPWDLIDLPAPSALKYLGICAVPEIIAETSAKVRELTNGSEIGSGGPPTSSETRRAGYWNPSSERFDFLAALLPAVGVTPVYRELESQKLVIVNCLDSKSSEVDEPLTLRPEQQIVAIIRASNRRQIGRQARIVALPTSFSRFCDEISEDDRAQVQLCSQG